MPLIFFLWFTFGETEQLYTDLENNCKQAAKQDKIKQK